MNGTSFIDHVKSLADEPLDKLPSNPETRKELVTILRSLATKLENPIDAVERYFFQPHQNAVIRTAIDLDLFVRVDKAGPNGVTADELGRLTGAEPLVIVRLMRVLTALGIFSELGEQRYASNPISKAWTAPTLRDGAKHMYDDAGYSVFDLPAFLKQNNYKNPTEHDRTSFSYAFKAKGTFFDFLAKRPERHTVFNTWMQGNRDARVPWYSYYPIENNLCRGLKSKDSVLLIDIGGNRGHDLEALQNAFPDHPGKLVLQDLPATIDDIKSLSPSIEAMKYDAFTPQPIKGARAYYFRSVFHDWPDHKVAEMLQNTLNAMEKGYSKVLINDWVLRDTGSPLFPATMDINMMSMLSAMERTEKQWRALLGSVGLRIVEIYGQGPEMESIIEAVQE